MEWTDEGIVLGVRRHGKSSAIVELLTRERGRHLGLVRGGASARMRPLLQPGNSVTAMWRARLDEHLGYYQLDGTRLRAANLLASSHAVYGVTHLASLARLLPERDPHQDIYEMLAQTLDDFEDAGGAAIHLIRFELAMLTELGFGLDLSNCAATGATSELVYVSPKSGGAVSRAAGEPWRDRLMRLPPFLREDDDGAHTARTRTCSMALRSPAASSCAMCWSRAGRGTPTRGKASSMRCCAVGPGSPSRPDGNARRNCQPTHGGSIACNPRPVPCRMARNLPEKSQGKLMTGSMQ